MNEGIQILINVCILIATLWAGGKVIVSVAEQWGKLGVLSKEVDDEIKELNRQLEAQWKKCDRMESILEARLDRVERQLNYLAGVSQIKIENLRMDTFDK